MATGSFKFFTLNRLLHGCFDRFQERGIITCQEGMNAFNRTSISRCTMGIDTGCQAKAQISLHADLGWILFVTVTKTEVSPQ